MKANARAQGGRVAIVVGGGSEIGRAIALDLSARGARVVVMGPVERALGEVVGEIASAGGKARHVVGDPGDAAAVEAAIARAVDTFGGLDLAVAVVEAVAAARLAFDVAARAMRGPGRLVAVCPSADAGPFAAMVGEVATLLAPRAITANAIVRAREDGEPEKVAERVAFLCSDAVAGVTGQAISI